jgi:hypothetical protein
MNAKTVVCNHCGEEVIVADTYRDGLVLCWPCDVKLREKAESLSLATMRIEQLEDNLDVLRALYHRVCRDLDDANATIDELTP